MGKEVGGGGVEGGVYSPGNKSGPHLMWSELLECGVPVTIHKSFQAIWLVWNEIGEKFEKFGKISQPVYKFHWSPRSKYGPSPRLWVAFICTPSFHKIFSLKMFLPYFFFLLTYRRDTPCISFSFPFLLLNSERAYSPQRFLSLLRVIWNAENYKK